MLKTCPTCEGRCTVTVKRKTGPGPDDWDYDEDACPQCGGDAVIKVEEDDDQVPV